jgi:hypothetical protein
MAWHSSWQAMFEILCLGEKGELATVTELSAIYHTDAAIAAISCACQQALHGALCYHC